MTGLPDFLIIGAMRAGTTSLYRYLRAHPGVFLTPKELQFFTDHFDEGLEWYRRQYTDAGADQKLGEATADYFARPSAMQRIAETLPDARLVVSLRAPTARAWSHYLLLRERGVETRTFTRALEEELDALDVHGDDAPGVFYLSHGMYEVHLDRARRLFGDDQIHITVFEQMVSDPHRAYREICRFIDVDPGFEPDRLGQPVNAYVQFRSLTLRRLARSLGGAPERILGRLNTRRGRLPPPLSARDRTTLDEFYAPRVARLESMLGGRIDEWASP